MTDLLSRLVFDVDKQGQQKIEKAVEKTKKKISELDGKELKQLGENAARAAQVLGQNFDHSLDTVLKGMRELGASDRQIDKVTQAFKRQQQQLERNAQAQATLQSRQSQFDAVSRNVGLAGDIQSNLGALNALSGGRFGAAGEVVALVEELPRLKAAVQGLPQTLASAASAVGPTGLAVGAALLGVAAVAEQVSQILQRNADEIQKRYETVLDLETRLERGEVTAQEFDQAIADLEGTVRGATNTIIQQRELAANAFRQRADEFGGGFFGDIFARLTTAAELATNTGVGGLVDTVRQAEDVLLDTSATLRTYNEYTDDNRVITEKAAKSLDDWNNALQDVARRQQQASDLIARYDTQAGDIRQDRAIRDQQQQEDFNARIEELTASHQARLADITRTGNARIEAIQADLNALPRQRAADIRNLETEANAERLKLLRDFNAEQTLEYEKFALKENQIRRKANLDALRLAEDFEDRKNDAAAAGDVEAFLRTQRERDKAIERQAEDLGIEAQTRAENFTQEQEQRRRELEQRLADLQSSLQKESAEITASYEKRRAALAEQLTQEQKQLQEAIAAQNAAFDQQQQKLTAAFEQQQQRQRQRDQIEDARKERDHQAELNRILGRSQLVQNALNLEIQAAKSLQSAARAAAQAAAQVGSATGSGIRSSSTRAGTDTRARNVPRFAFATGGLAIAQPGGIPAILAENGENELAVPVGNATGADAYVEAISRLSGSLGSRGGVGGITINVNDYRSFNVGDVASVSMVSQALQETTDIWTVDVIKAFEKARYGNAA